MPAVDSNTSNATSLSQPSDVLGVTAKLFGYLGDCYGSFHFVASDEFKARYNFVGANKLFSCAIYCILKLAIVPRNIPRWYRVI